MNMQRAFSIAHVAKRSAPPGILRQSLRRQFHHYQTSGWSREIHSKPIHFLSRPYYRPQQLLFKRNFSTRGPLNSWATHVSAKRAVWTIIGINIAVWGAWQYAHTTRDSRLFHRLTSYATLSWANLNADRWYTTITSAFSHATISHLIFNMWALHVFGSIMAMVPGVGGFHVWTLSIGSAAAGSLCWLYHRQTQLASQRNQTSGPFPRFGRRTVTRSEVAQGASGMVMAAGAVATCLMPFAPMYLMFIPIPIPLWLITGLYAAADMYYLDSSDQIGHAAHLGGSIFGVVYYTVFLRRFGGVLQGRGLRR